MRYVRARARILLSQSGWLIAISGCNPTGTPGAACLTTGDCQAGLSCLYAIGSGCDAQGACDVPPNGCLPGASTLVLCGCADATLDLSCIGDNATLPQASATGSICGGGDAAAEQ